MPCPFARLAAFASPLDVAAAKLYHQQHNLYKSDSASSASSSSSSSSQPLSEYLKDATAKAHREVESSQGVRQLMGLASSSSSSGTDIIFTRLDYVRWMVMLACIYAALEASLDVNNNTTRRAPALAPLYASRALSSPSKPLLAHLTRYEATMADIEAHLDVLRRSEANEEGAGLALYEMVDLLNDHGDEESDAVVELREAVAPFLARLSTSSTTSSPQLEDDHLRLLRPAQARSTANYVRRLAQIGGSDATEGQAPDLLLAHSYVRYLGDLSGGQHIRRRVEKIFPMSKATPSSSRGYDFYDFPSPSPMAAAASWHRELKDSFRDAMDAAPASVAGDDVLGRKRMMLAQGREASLAFELNKDLFEALVGNGPTTKLPALDAADDDLLSEKDELAATQASRPAVAPPSLGLKQIKFALSSPSKGHGPADLAAAAVLPLVCSALVVAVVARSVVAVATAGVVAA